MHAYASILMALMGYSSLVWSAGVALADRSERGTNGTSGKTGISTNAANDPRFQLEE
jgi:hypothetical protein